MDDLKLNNLIQQQSQNQQKQSQIKHIVANQSIQQQQQMTTLNQQQSNINQTNQQLMSLQVQPNLVNAQQQNVQPVSMINKVTDPTIQMQPIQQPAQQIKANQINQMDGKKRKLIWKQLVLIMHSHKCQRGEEIGSQSQCNVPACQTMKGVLAHMTTCQDGKNCKQSLCTSSKQIIDHWENCQKNDCLICLPLKQMAEKKYGQFTTFSLKPQDQSQPMQPADMQRAYQTLGLTYDSSSNAISLPANYNRLPNSSNSLVSGAQAMNSSSQTAQLYWHVNVSQELRWHLVQKIIQAILPSPDPNAAENSRMNSLIQYAQKVENDMYIAAKSHEEYYHLLAEKIHKILKTLEEKREKRKKEQQQSSLNPPANNNQLDPNTIVNTINLSVNKLMEINQGSYMQQPKNNGH